MASSRYRKIKVGSIRRKKIIILLIAISLLFISGGYSILNSELGLSGTLNVNKYNYKEDIRITKIELIDSKNNGKEISNSEYSKNITNMYVSLPNANSSVTYRVTITNKTSDYFTPGEIKTKVSTNSNVKYTIDGLENYGVYQGNTYTFNITFTTSLANQEHNLILEYDFNFVKDTVWDFSYVGSEKTFTSDYNTNYKLEVWGAQGGYAYQTKYHGGYGAYSKGEVALEKNNQLFINVGGSGGNALVLREVVSGGYNGGGANTADDENHKFIAGAGGGATHIAKVSGLLSSIGYDNRSNILIVAGGGGGATYNYNCSEAAWQSAFYGGSGGGATGLASHKENTSPNSTNAGGGYLGSGGTQTAGGAYGNYGISGNFGMGGYGTSYPKGAQTCGGGGGFYGGGSSWGTGCGGGSGYIANSLLTNKEMYCYGCPNSNDVDTKTIGVNTYSSTPTVRVAKEGNGYARITLLPKN